MLSREIIDQVCLYLPLEKAWHFSPYATKKIYNPEIHDARYWLKVTDNKDISIIKYFLEHKKLNQEDLYNLCCRACCLGRIDILQMLLNSYMDTTDINYYLCCKITDQKTFVMIAKLANYTTIRWLLDNNHYNIKNDDFSLYAAYGQKHMDAVKTLLECGGNLNLGDNRYIILFACEEGDYVLVKLLLKYGADITFNDNSALKYAKKNNHLHIVKLLSDYAMRNTLFKYIT
jgi:ankyrin repeat protein